MEAIILAGGFGTRLKARVPDLPKPMAPVAGRPFLEILLQTLHDQDFSHVVLSLGYLSHIVQKHFGDRFETMAISYEVENEPLGTGGALRNAMQHINCEHAFVLNGDTYVALRFADIHNFSNQVNAPVMVTRQVADAGRYGRVRVNSDNRIIGFEEKSDDGIAGLINAGVYLLPKNIFASLGHLQTFSLERDFFEPQLAKMALYSYESDGYFIDIGIPEDYDRAQSALATLRRG